MTREDRRAAVRNELQERFIETFHRMLPVIREAYVIVNEDLLADRVEELGKRVAQSLLGEPLPIVIAALWAALHGATEEPETAQWVH